MMENSRSRIEYISRRISEYTTAIRMLNSEGLFDQAKLFELFAQEVCKIWFGQNFNDLNQIQKNFPYVDLVSEDGKIYIQVSTMEDVPGKIRSTLQGLAGTVSEPFCKIEELYFFVIDNPSCRKVKDYVGENAIGKIEFEKQKHLITTQTILDKALYDLRFQRELFVLLQNDLDSAENMRKKLEDALTQSRFQIEQIVSRLNGEYEIDRSKYLEGVCKENKHFILVQGEAGAGKSALCKKYSQTRDLTLYVRADALAQFKNITEIWSCNIERMLQVMNEKTVCFFVDALEFIADQDHKSRALLMQLFEVVGKYESAYVIISCRTTDLNAFLDVLSPFDFYKCTVKELDDEELYGVVAKYPVVLSMMGLSSYREALRNPLYLNLIISQVHDINDIHSENELRRKIWREIICLGRDLPHGISSSQIQEAVRKIVFDRAIKFLPGISEDEIDRTILDLLLSKGVIIETAHRVRLKYDVFEDICFEIHLDGLFEECRGNYSAFFDQIDKLGRCKYRRYQIWVENKLPGKEERNRFIIRILFDSLVSPIWKEQTIIGLVRSRFTDQFFEDYDRDIYENNLFPEILRVLNLYSFEVSIMKLKNGDPYTVLHPIGYGRKSMIAFIARHRLEANPKNEKQILRLLTDYSIQATSQDKEISVMAADILEYYIDQRLTKILDNEMWKSTGWLMECLQPLYHLAEYAGTWIKEFWDQLKKAYLEDAHDFKHQLAEKIMEETIKTPPQNLVRFMHKELCDLSDIYWFSVVDDEVSWYSYQAYGSYNPFSLTPNADHYSRMVNNAEASFFFYQLFQEHFWDALNWGIKWINVLVEQYSRNNATKSVEIQVSKNTRKSFIGLPELWLVFENETYIPAIIGDFVYTLLRAAQEIIQNSKLDLSVRQLFAEKLKTKIFEKSNNIILLRVIAEIGILFERQLPGYAVPLASSLDLVAWDYQVSAWQNKPEVLQKLENSIWTTVGLPPAGKRYQVSNRRNLSDYILMIQLTKDEKHIEMVSQVLKRLYQEVEEKPENAQLLLNIQKMDLNSYHAKENGTLISLTPEFTGEARALIEENKTTTYNQENEKRSRIMNKLQDSTQTEKPDLTTVLEVIDDLRNGFHDLALIPEITQLTIELTVRALLSDELDNKNRSELCNYWISGINNIFENEVFLFDIKHTAVLFDQLGKELEKETEKELRKMLLRCILEQYDNGLIQQIAVIACNYLREHEEMANDVFRTIVEISKNRKAFEISGISENCPVDAVQAFIQGKNPVLDEREKSFSECEDELLSYVVYSGLKLDNAEFSSVLRHLLLQLLRDWKQSGKDIREALYQIEKNLSHYLTQGLSRAEQMEEIADFMFRDVDSKLFSRESIQFYTEVLNTISAVYFDAFNNAEIRAKCEKTLLKLEEYIQGISDETSRRELTKVLLLDTGHGPLDAWQNASTSFTPHDKNFLNRIWGKYGRDHLRNFLMTLYRFHIRELLPDVLISISESFSANRGEPEQYGIIAHEGYYLINTIITQVYMYFRDEVKKDEQLTSAYESILDSLVNIQFREAAVLADEFRTH